MSSHLEKDIMPKQDKGGTVVEPRMTLAEVRRQLEGKKGKRYWRSIDELANTPEFEAAVAKEFPDAAQEWVDPVSRRGFLKLMSASLALAGLAGCTKQPDEPIYPYVKQPEDLILGKSNYFATAFPFATGALPLLVKSDAYRPIKVDGNPDHPYNLGSSDVFAQGSLLDLYDADRSQHGTRHGETVEYVDFLEAFRNRLNSGKADGGEGIYILSRGITSPTMARQWSEAQANFPKARFVQYDPALAGTYLSKGVSPQYSLADADIIVSLDADFLSGSGFPGFHKLTREYAQKRKLAGEDKSMNRLYSIESTPSTTGMKAEHRLGLRASEIPAFAAALAGAIGASGAGSSSYTWTAEQTRFLNALATDLKAHAGKSVVIPGLYQDPSVAESALAINSALGNIGKTVKFSVATEGKPTASPDQIGDFKALVADLNAGKVDWLLMLNSNPVYEAPVDFQFKAALSKAKVSVHMGSHVDETGLEAIWHLPASHYLEMWSDARAYDGTVSVIQPLIEPLYGSHSAHDILQAMLDEPQLSAYEAVRETWKSTISKGGDFEPNWRKALHAGWVEGTSYSVEASSKSSAVSIPAPSPKDAFEIIFRPDPSIYDGRFSNVGWLQELPKPVTNLAWDNAALLSGATLVKLGLEEGDIVEITVGSNKVKAPILWAAGHPDNSATLHLGYGREAAGRVGSGAGFNAYSVRTSDAPFFATGSIKKVEGKWGLAVSKSHYQDHRSQTAGGIGNGNYSLEDNEANTRGVIRSATLEEYKSTPGFANEGEGHEKTHKDVTLFPNWQYRDNAWGMSIDLNSCTGCNACIVGCYAENNIAVVGKQQVRIGRNMQWLRIDTYFEGDLAAPRAHFQPMACQHCENAPCEQVCPVGATVHTPEGINTMVYNRCVGTRYCSNNCPYKVRRFNFLLFSDYETESLKLIRNPDVSVRSRGVMEKCSYCIQRISEAKIDADKENRAIRDGEILTACQQACPSTAITFGNINDRSSKVAKLQQDERSYSVLADLNTRPRTQYVAAVLNLNPELAEAPSEHMPEHAQARAESMATRDLTPRPKGTEDPTIDPLTGEFRVLAPGFSFKSVTAKISDIVLTPKTSLGWFAIFTAGGSVATVLLVAVVWLFLKGVGIWAITQPVAWGFAIINFVWWIGIGHAGTLISAILLLFKQGWRNSINRFAEAMTIFAVVCAGMFPLIHVGRPWLAYWLFPLPYTMNVWPQFRSPLLWDVFAVSTYATISVVFWYVGMIPDFGTLRDRSSSKFAAYIYGLASLGWRGSVRHWMRYETASLLLAGLATPLVLSVHTVISFDFAVAILPGWHTTIFPPYFVAGAIYSGFAMVLTLAIPLRKAYGLEGLVTTRHIDNMGKVMLGTGLIVAYGYGMEVFMAWFSASHWEYFMMWNRMFGPMGWSYWVLVFCNIAFPLTTLWVRKLRTNIAFMFLISIIVNTGMWFERFVIVVTSLYRDFLPSSWGTYRATKWDFMTYIGTLGLFTALFLLFVRLLPMIPMNEIKMMLPSAKITPKTEPTVGAGGD